MTKGSNQFENPVKQALEEAADDAVSEVGEEPVKAIQAAFDVYCPAGGSTNGSGGNSGSVGNSGSGGNSGSVAGSGSVSGAGSGAGSGAEQDRINKSAMSQRL